jgi:hypothetical protein
MFLLFRGPYNRESSIFVTSQILISLSSKGVTGGMSIIILRKVVTGIKKHEILGINNSLVKEECTMKSFMICTLRQVLLE